MWGHHLESCLQHADDRAVGAVFAFVEPAQAVEVTEELVSAIDEMNNVEAFAHVAGAEARATLCAVRAGKFLR
jgi:hypothetical protein